MKLSEEMREALALIQSRSWSYGHIRIGDSDFDTLFALVDRIAALEEKLENVGAIAEAHILAYNEAEARIAALEEIEVIARRQLHKLRAENDPDALELTNAIAAPEDECASWEGNYRTLSRWLTEAKDRIDALETFKEEIKDARDASIRHKGYIFAIGDLRRSIKKALAKLEASDE